MRPPGSVPFVPRFSGPPEAQGPLPSPDRVSGHDLEVVQGQLGQASIKTTTIYARVRIRREHPA